MRKTLFFALFAFALSVFAPTYQAVGAVKNATFAKSHASVHKMHRKAHRKHHRHAKRARHARRAAR